tara:strand:- start:701 stop:880 length:180 start_codon:yes stop_codon:yes gene_type:complete
MIRRIRKNRRAGNTNFIAARSSLNWGRRACLCPDTSDYSRECCDGSIWAQGVGVVTRIS